MNYSLDDNQWKQDWINMVSLAATAGSSLEQTHVFALAHILRRPIIVYAVKFVKSRKGETIDYARFEGRFWFFIFNSSLWGSKINVLACKRLSLTQSMGAGHTILNTLV